jgi:hypothetical protein
MSDTKSDAMHHFVPKEDSVAACMAVQRASHRPCESLRAQGLSLHESMREQFWPSCFAVLVLYEAG